MGVVTHHPADIRKDSCSISISLTGNLDQIEIQTTAEYKKSFGRYKEWTTSHGFEMVTQNYAIDRFGIHDEYVGERVLGYTVTPQSDPCMYIYLSYSHTPYKAPGMIYGSTHYLITVEDRDSITPNPIGRDSNHGYKYNNGKTFNGDELSEDDIKTYFHDAFLDMINLRSSMPSLRQRQNEATRRIQALIPRINQVRGKVISKDELAALNALIPGINTT